MKRRIYTPFFSFFLFSFSAFLSIPHIGLCETKVATTMKDHKKSTDTLSLEESKKKLSPEQFRVTQKEETERPFKNAYWDNKADGIYVDVVSGEPLFSSLDKYDSGSGWPSFHKPLEEKNVSTKMDNSLLMPRTEVHSSSAKSHLGHIFQDGPSETGLRYCVNSASLRFIPKDQLEKEGYGKYLSLFKSKDTKEKKTSMKKQAVATLAGGCFWGVEELFRKLPGVITTKVGYTGGFIDSPTYDLVKRGDTGHAESIEVTYDPEKTSYEEILKFFFKMHDPTTVNQQGNDVGSQYRSAIFYHDEEQKKAAEKVKALVDASGQWKKKVVTEIVPAGKFYSAEEYHQDYLQKNPAGYTCHYVRKLDF